MKYRLFLVLSAVVAILTTGRQGVAQENFALEIFGRYLNPLVADIGMPGVSAAIIQTGPVGTDPIIRYYNVGFADVEQRIEARSDTPYPIGGVTQAMTGVLAGVCIDRFTNVFDINSNIRLFVPPFPVAETSVRQVLTHSTGGQFRYDPLMFVHLTSVIESPQCLNMPFRRAVAREVLDRLVPAMTRSVPGMDLNRPEGDAARALFDEADVDRYQRVLRDLAVPYKIDARRRATRSEYPSYGLDAASGMVSTVEDLVSFEIALDSDDGVPLSNSTLNQMWSNQTFDLPQANGTTVRVEMPTGLGWFVTNESGQRLVWTFGHIRDAASALIVKMTPNTTRQIGPGNPNRTVTLIMLANSGGLANGYDLENANVTSSPFVKVFLRLFI